MADWHVLTRDGGGYRLAFHIAIPVGNNAAGVSYRTAVVNSGLGGKTALLDGDGTAGTISAAEKTAILTTGSIIEVVTSLDVPDALSGAAKLALLQAHYDGNAAAMLTALQIRLSQYGRTG